MIKNCVYGNLETLHVNFSVGHVFAHILRVAFDIEGYREPNLSRRAGPPLLGFESS
jgi:hypothetical protein